MLKQAKANVIKGYRTSMVMNEGTAQNRILVGIPVTGDLRAEWVFARYGQVIPCNWSQNDLCQWVDSWSPMRFMVADARNLIVASAMEIQPEWLVFIDHDVILPPLFLVTLNDYMIEKKSPLFSGLYFTKSVPSEPLVYRGRGNGYYANWKFGDKVAVDGLPMGCTAIHFSIIKILWDESPEYNVGGRITRRVFETPVRVFYDPETRSFNTQTGTEDLELCSRIIREGTLAKAGWKTIAKRPFPFLIDTTLFCWHITPNGIRYPSMGEQMRFMRKGEEVEDRWGRLLASKTAE